MNPFSSEEFWQCFPSSKTVPYARYRCSLTPSLSLLVSNYLLLSLQMEGEGHRLTRAGRVDDVAFLSCLLFALRPFIPQFAFRIFVSIDLHHSFMIKSQI